MGARLASFYEQAESVGGLEAKIRMAILTRVPSTRAHVESDSPENIARFEGARMFEAYLALYRRVSAAQPAAGAIAIPS